MYNDINKLHALFKLANKARDIIHNKLLVTYDYNNYYYDNILPPLSLSLSLARSP